MTEARSTDPAQEMTCPRCGYVQPRAQQCSHCGLTIARYRPRPVLKGRERALSAARAYRSSRRRYLRWITWLVSFATIAVAGAWIQQHWLPGLGGDAADSLTAELREQYPALLGLEAEDPAAWDRLQGEMASGLESGVPREQVMAQAVALLREALRERRQMEAAPTPTTRAPSPSLADQQADSGPDSVELGAVGDMIGVRRLKLRKCSGSGKDAECIEQFEDVGGALDDATGRRLDHTSAGERIDAFRRKANQYYEALDDL